VLAMKTSGRQALDKGVHHALADSRWMQENISTHPTWIAEVVSLPQVAKGHCDASGLGAGGLVPTLPPALVSLLHSLLYGTTDGQNLSPLGW
jgi:hypothetical protein